VNVKLPDIRDFDFDQFLGDFDLTLCLSCAKITLTSKYTLFCLRWCNNASLLIK